MAVDNGESLLVQRCRAAIESAKLPDFSPVDAYLVEVYTPPATDHLVFVTHPVSKNTSLKKPLEGKVEPGMIVYDWLFNRNSAAFSLDVSTSIFKDLPHKTLEVVPFGLFGLPQAFLLSSNTLKAAYRETLLDLLLVDTLLAEIPIVFSPERLVSMHRELEVVTQFSELLARWLFPKRYVLQDHEGKKLGHKQFFQTGSSAEEVILSLELHGTKENYQLFFYTPKGDHYLPRTHWSFLLENILDSIFTIILQLYAQRSLSAINRELNTFLEKITPYRHLIQDAGESSSEPPSREPNVQASHDTDQPPFCFYLDDHHGWQLVFNDETIPNGGIDTTLQGMVILHILIQNAGNKFDAEELLLAVVESGGRTYGNAEERADLSKKEQPKEKTRHDPYEIQRYYQNIQEALLRDPEMRQLSNDQYMNYLRGMEIQIDHFKTMVYPSDRRYIQVSRLVQERIRALKEFFEDKISGIDEGAELLEDPSTRHNRHKNIRRGLQLNIDKALEKLGAAKNSEALVTHLSSCIIKNNKQGTPFMYDPLKDPSRQDISWFTRG